MQLKEKEIKKCCTVLETDIETGDLQIKKDTASNTIIGFAFKYRYINYCPHCGKLLETIDKE